MKTLDIFHTLFIIYVFVTKTMITFLDTFNFCFTEKKKKKTSLRGVCSPTLPYVFRYKLAITRIKGQNWMFPTILIFFPSQLRVYVPLFWLLYFTALLFLLYFWSNKCSFGEYYRLCSKLIQTFDQHRIFFVSYFSYFLWEPVSCTFFL